MPVPKAIANWTRDLLSNGFGGRLLAGVGGIATLLGLTQVLAPAQTAEIPHVLSVPFLAACVIILIFLAGYSARPKHAIVFGFRGLSAWNITIKRGDLFDSDVIVVTVDRLASTARDAVGGEALVASLAERWFAGSIADLDAVIGLPSQRSDLLPVGETIPFTQNGKRGWLLCLAEPTDHGPRTTWQDLHTAYDKLWGTLRRANVPLIAVPVVGSGYARAQLSLEGLLYLMILSYHSACLTGRVAANLEIVILGRDYRPITLTTAGRLLAALGYHEQ